MLKDGMRVSDLAPVEPASTEPVSARSTFTRSAQPQNAETFAGPPRTRQSERARTSRAAAIMVDDSDELSAPRWTEQNPDWDKSWKTPLVYQRTTVDKEDISRLDEGQCLNDNLINFGLRYLYDRLGAKFPSFSKRVYFHNSYFYEKLTSDKSYRGKINYDGVKNWTSRVDLLSYDYIIVPVNEHYHWWLAIICHPGRLDADAPRPWTGGGAVEGAQVVEAKDTQQTSEKEVPSDVEVVGEAEKKPLRSPGASTTAEMSQLRIASPQCSKYVNPDADPNDRGTSVVDLIEDETTEKAPSQSIRKPAKRGRKSSGPPPRVYDPDEPRIVTLDSMGGSHYPSVSVLKLYLLAEFEHKRNKVLENVPAQLGMKAVNVPEQNNVYDCGVYLLGYVYQFVLNPDQFVQNLVRKESTEWNLDSSHERMLWRETIFKEQSDYQNKALGSVETPAEGSAETFEQIQRMDWLPNDKYPEAKRVANSNSDTHKSNDVSPKGSKEPPELREGSGEKGGDITGNPAAEFPKEREICNEPTEPPEDNPNGETSGEPSSPRVPKAPGSWPSQGSGDEISLLEPSEDAQLVESTVLQSIEQGQESMKHLRPVTKFLPKLGSSPPPPPPPQRSDKHSVEEIDSKTHIRNKSSPPQRPDVAQKGGAVATGAPLPGLHIARQVRSPPNRIGANQQRRQPVQSTVPMVQAAELVRPSEPIDLTEEEPGVI